MKKVTLIFIMTMVFCSVSFAQSNKTEGMISTAGKAAAGEAVGEAIDAVTGTEISDVASDVRDVAAVATTAAAVTGTSGAGIMSTMAATGAVVGGGVVAGTAFTAGVGSFGAASLMNKYVFDGDTEADEAARVGTYSGAAVGTIVNLA